MIKFFRHIRQTLLMENKTSKYFKYAIGEILLVVIGILIALQINTWNQERVNAREERRILQDLSKELRFNNFLKEKGSRVMQEVVDAADRLLLVINNQTEQRDTSQIGMYLHKLTWVWVSGRNTTIYDVLSGSGDFDNISSSVLRKKLADLKANQENLLQFEVVQNQFVDQQLRPFLNRAIDRTTMRSKFETGEMITTMHASKFPNSYSELLESREFANLLVDLDFFTRRVLGTYGRIDRDITQIDSLIQSKYPDIVAKVYTPY
ncbi:MAG: DUF6090 family protein [Flavobacteriaceae bacterium]